MLCQVPSNAIIYFLYRSLMCTDTFEMFFFLLPLESLLIFPIQRFDHHWKHRRGEALYGFLHSGYQCLCEDWCGQPQKWEAVGVVSEWFAGTCFFFRVLFTIDR